MSTVGLELKNFLNGHLAWKTVVKGNRSATRRSRKSVAKNLSVGAELGDKIRKRSDEGTVSESEKLGVAVLGRRFSDKMEHVPIKKRKFNFRSPSPPPQNPSPQTEIQHASYSNGKVVMETHASSLATSSPHVDEKISEAFNGRINCGEDFSGIEILAAAACHNNFDGDVEHTEEEKPVMESSRNTEGSEIIRQKSAASLETANLLSKGLGPKDRLGGSTEDNTTFPHESVTDNVDKVVENSNSVQDKDDKSVIQVSVPLGDKDVSLVESSVSVQKQDPSVIENSIPVRDDRLHWDLNVSMDAWQQPCDDGANDDTQANGVDGNSRDGSAKLENLKGCELSMVTDDVKHDYMVDPVVSSELNGETKLALDSKSLFSGPNREDNQLAACSGLNQKYDGGGLDVKSSSQVASIDDNLVSNTKVFNFLDEKVEDGSLDLPKNGNVSAKSILMEDYNNTHSSVSILDRVSCEVSMATSNENGEDSVRASRMFDDLNAPQEFREVDNCLPLVPVSLGMQPLNKAEEVCVRSPSTRDEDVFISNATVEEVKFVETDNLKGIASEAVSGQTTEIDCSLRVGSEDSKHISSGSFVANMDGSGKVNIEDPSDDIYESDAFEDDVVRMAGKENSRELQGGYDSQFEDGELRESDLQQGFEENEGEVADVEQVDYESECDGDRLCNLEMEDITEKKSSTEDGSSPRRTDEMTEKFEQSAVEESLRDCLTSSKAVTVGVADASKIEKTTVDCESGPGTKEFTPRLVGSRISKRELISHTEGCSSSDAVPRSRSENSDDMCPRLERDAGSNKFMGRDRYDPYGSGRGRPRSIIESRGFVGAADNKIAEGGVAVEGVDNRVRRQYFSSSSNNFCRPLNRRSLSYRGEVYGMQSDVCPDRSRFRRYPQGGMRERPPPNYSNDYPEHMLHQHRIGRRERSISPPGGERLNHNNYPQSYKKSRSRSRSHSPTPWLLPREQNEGGLRRSRSPNFRSTRMDGRVRLPPQKPFAAAEYDEGFISPPRNRFSPHRNSRFDDQVSELDNSRERKSPGRMIRQELSYRRSVPNFSDDNPNHLPPHHVARGERSISPPLGGERERLGNYAQSYKKPPRSRSRSRSPNTWMLPNERNVGGFRRRGRSPSFRSNRAERVRLPFQKRFAAEYEEEFISPPRNRFSPQRNPRFEGRVMDNNFRERKSPVRMFRQGQRFDSVRPMRPMMHPRRFGDMVDGGDGGGGGGRGFGDMGGGGRGGGRGRGFNNNYEGGGDDDRRKLGNRYEMINRVRRYDSDGGGVRRFDV